MSESTHLSKQQIQSEIVKCGQNPEYFINHYVQIVGSGGLIPFDTYEYQDRILEQYQNERHNIILKPRQMGISTLTGAYTAWKVLFHKHQSILITANKRETASELLDVVKKQINRLPEWLMLCEFEKNNINEIKLDNQSRVKSAATAPDAGRGMSLDLLVVDEAAHVDNMENMWSGVYPTLSETGGDSIIISTPKGINWFHEKYTAAAEGRNNFNAIKLDWKEHPERDEEWYEQETQNMSKRKVAQEIECDFLASGDTVIASSNIDDAARDVEDPMLKQNLDRNFWIWEHYHADGKYYITADVAKGTANDHSAFHVIEAEECKQVAEYKGQAEPDIFADILVDAGKMFGECLIVVENNNVGYNVLTKLREKDYSNIFYSKKGTLEKVEPSVAEASNQRNITAGVRTTTKSRPKMIAQLEEYIRNNALTIKSERTINEMRTFIWNKGKPQAMDGYNDDLMMSLAIACWLRDNVIIKAQRDAKYKKELIKGIGGSSKQLNTSMENPNNRGSMGIGPDVQRSRDKLEEKREKAKENQRKYKWLYVG